jgi:glutamate synthase domain-containing protein 1
MTQTPANPLYVPEDRDACGIGFVAHVDGRPRREIVRMALDGLCGVKHRGAIAADEVTGDGAGVLTQIPRELLSAHVAELGHADVHADDLGVAFLFLQPGDDERAEADRASARAAV